jgi:hypothetical protein
MLLRSEMTAAPLNLLNQKLITEGPFFWPSLVLGCKWAPPETRPYASVGIMMQEDILGCLFAITMVKGQGKM